MAKDQSNSDDRQEFEQRIKTMSTEELLALAEILKRRSGELHEELKIVSDELASPKRKRKRR
jgi:hypothetical protein